MANVAVGIVVGIVVGTAEDIVILKTVAMAAAMAVVVVVEDVAVLKTVTMAVVAIADEAGGNVETDKLVHLSTLPA